MKTIDINVVKLFLKTAAKEINAGNRKLINRTIDTETGKISTKDALLELGIVKIKQVWEYVLKLKPEECVDISHDYDFKRDENDDMYIFITTINNMKTYIKLTINSSGVLCLSFHKSRY